MRYNIGIVSLGCAKNATDSETMLGILSDKGYKIVSDPESADIIIVNTCGFIETAKQESIDTILEMAQYKEGRCRMLIVTGCLAERYNTEVLEQFPEIDAVCGVGDYHRIAEIIESVTKGDRPLIYGHANEDVPENLPRILTTPQYTAYLKIAEGCNNNCTYCAIPKIRGRYRSRKKEDIIQEAKNLAKKGVKEIIVIAQDTTRYGMDLYGKYCLDELLNDLCKIDEIRWIRVHYFYTEAITDSLLETMAANDKICNYIDMPIQHINDDILRRMARRTNRHQIEEKIKKMRMLMPDCVIRTSIISGFPGETDEQFNELYQFLADYKLERVGVFTYSAEEDTPAAEFPNQIDEGIKSKRRDKLMTLQQSISTDNNRSMIGKTIEVLNEGFDSESYLYFGRSRGDSIGIDQTVYFGAEFDISPGDFVKVKILDCNEYELMGQMTERI